MPSCPGKAAEVDGCARWMPPYCIACNPSCDCSSGLCQSKGRVWSQDTQLARSLLKRRRKPVSMAPFQYTKAVKMSVHGPCQGAQKPSQNRMAYAREHVNRRIKGTLAASEVFNHQHGCSLSDIFLFARAGAMITLTACSLQRIQPETEEHTAL